MIRIDKTKCYLVGDYVYTNYTNLSQRQKLEVFEARNLPIVREKMYNTEPLLLDDHLAFIESLKTRDDRFYWYITKNDVFVGSFNVTDINQEECSCESGIFFTDTGLSGIEENIKFAFNTLCFMFEELGIEKVTGFVKEDNLFNLQINSFFGFDFVGKENGFVRITMNRAEFMKMEKENINLRSYLKSVCSKDPGK